MNKHLYYFLNLFLLASLVITTSCGTDDDEALANRPAIEITGIDDPARATVAAGEEIAFTVNINAPGGFNVLRVNKAVGQNGTPVLIDEVSRPAGQPTNTFTYNFQYTPSADEANESLYFDFVVVDDAGLDNRREFILEVTEPELVVYEEELLFAPLENGSSKTWFSTIPTSDTTYTSAEVNATQETISNLIDFGYFYGATKEATIASVANYPINAGQEAWTVKHDTKIKKTSLPSSAFFEANSAAGIQQVYDDASFGTSGEGQATNLAEGNVIAFMTDPDSPGGSRYGLIHVSSITAGAGTEGRVLINVKVMP